MSAPSTPRAGEPAPFDELLEPADFARVVDELAAELAAERAVLGVAVGFVPPFPGKRQDPDPRRRTVSLLALATRTRTVLIRQDCAPAWPRLRALLAGPRPPYVVFHDAHVGLAALAGLHLPAPPRVGCVRTAAVLVAEGVRDEPPEPRDPASAPRRHTDPFSVASLALRHLRLAIPEGDAPSQIALGERGTRLWAPPERVATEAHLVLRLMEALSPRLRERGLVPVFDLECRLLPAVIGMEGAGIAVDGPRWERVAEQWRTERQVAADLERQAQLDKLISTYAHWSRDYLHVDGRMHPRFDPLGADSGRFACSQPNLQQVPSEHTAPGLRACFTPAPGHVFIIADYAQIELRVAAHLAPCAALRQVFLDGRDPHRATAATLAGKPEAEVSAHERKLAKAVNFGFLFGMGAPRFQEYAAGNYGLELDLAAAERAREAFFATFPGIAAWHRKVAGLAARAAREDITVRTVLGRRKRFPAGHFSFNAALNIPVQGTAAEGFKRAMTLLLPALDSLGGRGVLCVHDEYLAEVPEEHAEAARALVRDVMQRAMAEVVPSVPIVADARVARTWAE